MVGTVLYLIFFFISSSRFNSNFVVLKRVSRITEAVQLFLLPLHSHIDLYFLFEGKLNNLYPLLVLLSQPIPEQPARNILSWLAKLLNLNGVHFHWPVLECTRVCVTLKFECSSEPDRYLESISVSI